MIREALAVALADVRERGRSTRLLVVPVLIAAFAKLVTVDSTLVVAEEYSGVPTAAWYGGAVTGIGTIAFLLFGFLLVKGSVLRDRETGVDTLVAASPVSNAAYLAGKWAGNFALLALATAVLLVSTAVAFVLGGTGPVDASALATPFVLVTLPTMAVVAAAAVCFETVRSLRGTAGSVVYFFAALAAIVVGISPEAPLDVTGLVVLRESMAASIADQYPNFAGPIGSVAYTNEPGTVQPFRWSGLAWTPAVLVSRVPVVGLAAGLFALALVAFDRFDDTGGWSLPSLPGSTDAEAPTDGGEAVVRQTPADVSLSPVSRGGARLRRALLAELRLSVRGRSRWWYLACAGAVVAATLAPLDAVRRFVLPVALLLPLPAWSHLGAREHVHRTAELVLVGTRPVHLLAAAYLGGIGIGFALAAPAIGRFALAGATGPLGGLVAGLLFLPAAALAAGAWSGRPRVFEVGYLTAWYLGPINGVGPLDYLGSTDAAVAGGLPFAYLGLAVAGLGAALVARRRRFA